MFATQSPQTPFRQTHYTPTRSSPLRKHNTTPPIWTMSPTRSIQGASQSTAPNPFSNPPPTFNIQTEPLARHVQNHRSPIPMHFNASVSASTTPTSSNPFLNHTQTPTSPSSPTRQKPKYEARYASTIANPLQGAAGLARSKTRKMFLNRVRNERDDGRFEARGEQMMRMEHLADRRRWEESMARDGEGVIAGFEGEVDEDDMLPGMLVSGSCWFRLLGIWMCVWIEDRWIWTGLCTIPSGLANPRALIDDVHALDEFMSQEEAMEMALWETQIRFSGRIADLRSNGPDVPSSDDEYDDIFMGLSEPQGNQCQSQSQCQPQSQSQDMDMS
ncbi:unnamed protein product [Penicillium nalgiovense]|uniref:Uncharacterized protein n=1 Tax=Penicillium nalgiovense TaxID=60175 RepID=A0A9W4MPG9_PENNA|nr:unnamed protein product [Penicillium nalgiovense]CAG7943872.1 unnamed protein product [Penicillium nalgiovense]CAG7952495.1 unnamed protein product [Penicillium nalgiovense]CAG7961922.1 unnamed protein product [Penicillium nalgiovense]CAG7966351.1 unnamed protein product [Penicillium nalgiovense]